MHSVSVFVDLRVRVLALGSLFTGRRLVYLRYISQCEQAHMRVVEDCVSVDMDSS